MPYLKKLVKNGNGYYYLFHTIREGEKFKKVSKYLGKKKPSQKDLEKLKEDFMSEIKDNFFLEKNDYKTKLNLVKALQDIQDEKGYLSEKELKKLSIEKGIPGTNIFSVSTFYSQFKLEKPAKHTIYVCTGTACHVKGSSPLIKFLEQTLGIKAGETTKNGLVALETVNCIGACAKAPAIMINDKVYGKVTNQMIVKLIEKLK